MGGCTISLSPEVPQLATISSAVSVREVHHRITVAAADREVLLHEKLKLDAVLPGFPSHFKPHLIRSARMTIGAYGGLTVEFPRKQKSARRVCPATRARSRRDGRICDDLMLCGAWHMVV